MFPQPLNYHSPEGASKCLVMENIPDHWKEIELFQIFHSFGSIKNVQLIKKLNASGTHFCQYGIIQFQNQDSAHNALLTLQGQLFNGFVIRLVFLIYFLFLLYLFVFFLFNFCLDCHGQRNL